MTPASDPRIIPGEPPPDDGEAISPDVWGFRDSGSGGDEVGLGHADDGKARRGFAHLGPVVVLHG